MSSKIEVLVGISGSGKSKYAKEKRDGAESKTIIVSRDKLRECLFGYREDNVSQYYYDQDLSFNEQVVSDQQDEIIRRALVDGFDVIVDNTHLRESYLNKYKNYGVTVKYTLIECGLPLAYARDSERTRRVGQKIIKKQYDQLQSLKKKCNFETFEPEITEIVNDPTKPGCYIFDLDGTLAERFDRGPYDWHKVGQDKPRMGVVNTLINSLKAYNYEDSIIFCTGRDECCRIETSEWIEEHTGLNMSNHRLYMRKEGDMRKDWIVKSEMWKRICEDFKIEAIYDDRAQVVDVGRRLGFNMFQVDYGNF